MIILHTLIAALLKFLLFLRHAPRFRSKQKHRANTRSVCSSSALQRRKYVCEKASRAVAIPSFMVHFSDSRSLVPLQLELCLSLPRVHTCSARIKFNHNDVLILAHSLQGMEFKHSPLSHTAKEWVHCLDSTGSSKVHYWPSFLFHWFSHPSFNLSSDVFHWTSTSSTAYLVFPVGKWSSVYNIQPRLYTLCNFFLEWYKQEWT